MKLGDGVVGKERLGRTGGAEALAHVLGGVLDACGIDQEAMVDAREQRPTRASCDVAPELGRTDQDERAERARAPVVVEQPGDPRLYAPNNGLRRSRIRRKRARIDGWTRRWSRSTPRAPRTWSGCNTRGTARGLSNSGRGAGQLSPLAETRPVYPTGRPSPRAPSRWLPRTRRRRTLRRRSTAPWSSET